MSLSADRASKLADILTDRLRTDPLENPIDGELERAFTARCLAPIVESVIKSLPGSGLKFRGDGSKELAVPARAMGVDFYPDLAVSLGNQNIWAAEVKLIRQTGRQSAVATAIGQSTLYTSRYAHVATVLIDVGASGSEDEVAFTQTEQATGLRFVIRRRYGSHMLNHLC